MLLHESQKMIDEKSINEQPWRRVPEVCRSLNIGKSRLYELLNEAHNKIRVCMLRSPGAVKGIRLIHLPSVVAYLDFLATEQGGLK